MAGEFIHTIGLASQIPDAIQGQLLKGRGENRIALVGRSNVGKSSLINSILGVRLAQVSKEPGKTRNIHFYLWKDGKKILADLPGYGFAKASHGERDRWGGFINAYLRQDDGLERALVLLDARHGPTEIDRKAIGFLSFEQVPITFVFTKSDSLKTQSERVMRRREAAQALEEMGFDPKEAVWVSSAKGDGMRDLIRVIHNHA